jgi:sortase A
LKQGIGFYPQSEEPGLGNTCIAGHRNAYGSPFWHLDKLQPGDEIILYYNNRAFYYRVSLNYITHSRDWSVIADTDDAVITLTTCDPKIRPADGKYNRLIIRGKLVQVNPQVPKN